MHHAPSSRIRSRFTFLLRLCPSQRLVDMSWESVSQLTGVRRQVHVRLLEFRNHGLSGTLVSTELTVL